MISGNFGNISGTGKSVSEGVSVPGDGQDLTVYEADSADLLLVGKGAWLLTAKFVQDGGNLVLVGADGSKVIVRGYFQYLLLSRVG